MKNIWFGKLAALAAIVQRVVALHGGRMAVRNTAPGLRVELHLPH